VEGSEECESEREDRGQSAAVMTVVSVTVSTSVSMMSMPWVLMMSAVMVVFAMRSSVVGSPVVSSTSISVSAFSLAFPVSLGTLGFFVSFLVVIFVFAIVILIIFLVL